MILASEWQSAAAAHLKQAQHHTLPARERHTTHQPHPIEDFLFGYYPFALSLLEKWHPGVGIPLQRHGEIPPHLLTKHYRVTENRIEADPGTLTNKQRLRLQYTIELLEATRDRAPNYGCHGLHEWAMVYRGQDIRHEKTLSLRLPQGDIDALIESRPLCCSHFDAFRFFTREAQPFNLLQPTLHGRPSLEQPACVHANMDLYKWSAKAMPWVGSALLLDCFELALQLRDLDMRASPYDLRPWGREAIPIETPHGRRQYESEQRTLAARAKPLRQRLIDAIKDTLTHTPCQPNF
ncbi:MAG: 3-methyladenine DNA glycosylase [Burkholderiaceae bacterium]